MFEMIRISPEEAQRLFPKAVLWVTQMEQTCMEKGNPLPSQNRRDGERMGIREIAAVRVMILPEMPLPSDPELRQLCRQSNLIMPDTGGMTFGYGMVLKHGCFSRLLIAHELGHVLQYERFGGIEKFLAAYIPEVIFHPYYPNGPLEREADRLANGVCVNPS
jgi:hypothetical protein